jgi:hypothetical protein
MSFITLDYSVCEEQFKTGIGPVPNYAHKIGKADVAGEVKWLPELGVDKRLKSDYLWVKLGMADGVLTKGPFLAA